MPESPPLYVRKLSAIERYNLVINEINPYNVESIIEGVGELELEPWQQAVAIAAEANPGVRVRLKSVLGFCKWVDSGISPVVKLVSAPNWDGQSEQGADFMQKKFNVLEGGPVFDVKLLPGSPARIVFSGVHGAIDGRGIAHFIRDVFRVLRSEQPIGGRDTVTDLDIRLQHQDKVTVEEQAPVSCIAAMPVKPAENEPLRYLWRRLKLNKNVTHILPKMAVFLAKQAYKHEQGAVSFMVPVDFRDLRSKVNSTANLTGYLKIKVEPTDTPRDVMRRINQEIRSYGDCFNPGFLKILPWVPIWLLKKQLAKKIHKLLYTTNEEMATGGLVSMGHLKLEQACYPGFSDPAIIAIPGMAGKLNVIMCHFSNSTEITFGAPAAYNKEQQLDRLIADFSAEFG